MSEPIGQQLGYPGYSSVSKYYCYLDNHQLSRHISKRRSTHRSSNISNTLLLLLVVILFQNVWNLHSSSDIRLHLVINNIVSNDLKCDGGTGLKTEFLGLCTNMPGIKKKCSGNLSPQPNVILEKLVHQVLRDLYLPKIYAPFVEKYFQSAPNLVVPSLPFYMVFYHVTGIFLDLWIFLHNQPPSTAFLRVNWYWRSKNKKVLHSGTPFSWCTFLPYVNQPSSTVFLLANWYWRTKVL